MHKPLIASMFASLVLLAAGDPPAAPARVGYAWPLPTCAVSGEPLGDTPVVKVLQDAKDPAVNGREVRFCCEKCVATFDANRAKYLQEADATIAARQAPGYPLTTCVMMPDEKLPAADAKDQDGARNVVVGNQLVRVCCAQCERKVRRNPQATLDKVQAALVAAQVPGYPSKTCPVSGKPLSATPSDMLIGGQLVRLCCPECRASAEKDPAGTLAKVKAPPAK